MTASSRKKTPPRKKTTPASRKATSARKPSSGAKQQQPPKKLPLLPIIFVGLTVVLVGVLLFTGNTGSEFGDPEVTGSPLPLFTNNPSEDPALDMVAPEVVGADFDGNEVAIRHDGTPKAILLLAHWCSFCREEVPEVQRWIDAGGAPAGVEIMTVSTSANSTRENYPPSEWLAREGWTPPVVVDNAESSVAAAYGLSGFPMWVFLDGEGKVKTRTSGATEIPVLQGFLTALASQ